MTALDMNDGRQQARAPMRIFSLVLFALLGLATNLGGLSAEAATGSYVRTPEGLVVTPASGPAKRVRLQVMSDRIVHVTAVPGDGFDLPKSLMVTAAPETDGRFTVARRGGAVLLKTPKLTAEVRLSDGAVDFRKTDGRVVLAENGRGNFRPVKIERRDFYAVHQAFNPGTDEAFYGLGQHQNAQMNYSGQDVELAQHNMDVAIPFVLSSRNYGVLWDNNSITRFGNPRPYGLASRDLKLYTADGKPGGLTARYLVEGKLRLTRVEPDIDYQYIKDQTNWPAGLKGAKGLSVVWEGQVEPRLGGVQKFQLYASSYFRLWIDGRLVLDRWRQNWNPWYHDFDVPIRAGERHSIRIEWIPDDGYIALLHNDPLPAAERHSLSLASEAGQAIDYYFIDGDSLDQVISGYRQLTGKAVLLPRWAYGFWQSRERYKTEDELLGVVKEYRARHIPLDNIVQDWLYWREDDWGSHRFEAARYPDPKGMIDQVHALGAHFMISVWPKFYPTTDNYKELDALGHIYRRNVELGIKDWVGPGYLSSFYDPYSEEARRIYWRQIDETLNVLGVDAWWLDASEPDIESNVDIEERKLRMSPTALGPGGALFNSYPLLHTTAVYQGWLRSRPDVRPFILTRSAFAGEQRNASAVWSGDVASRWTDLKNQISAGVNFSMSGIPNWTFDIGGFALEHRYEQPNAADLAEWRELNLRWFQFGAFAPLFRSHGQAPYREIYNLAPEGSQVYDSLVAYDRLRYRLMPYIYTLAADTYHRDGTIMRGLPMDFPADPKVRDLNDEYLFGRAFLVSPVYEYRARMRRVYLPGGARWYDFHSGRLYDGGQAIAADAPLSRMPLFVRAGSIVPVGPAIEHTGEKPDAPVTLYVYTGADGAFSLYEDDGVSNGYQRGQFSRIPIAYNDGMGMLTIGNREGRFPGMVAQRTFNVRWIRPDTSNADDLDAAPDLTVTYAGRALIVRR